LERLALHDRHLSHGSVLTGYFGWELPEHYGDPVGEYLAARAGTGLIDRTAWGRLVLTGRDRAALLHRMSTNVVEGLLPGQGVATVLTSPTARIVERLILYAQEERLLAITAPQNRTRVAQYLRGYIFWQDEVHIGDLSGELGMLTLFGPRAAETVRTAAGVTVSDLLHHFCRLGFIAGAEALVARADPIGGDAYNVLVPIERLAAAWDALIEAGARPAGLSTWETMRVEAGIPAYGQELTEKVTPLDAGLLADISFNKGCYTGQEVIARMYNYEKMPRGLYGLRLAYPLPSGKEAAVVADGKPAGEITSVAVSPSLGPIALAILRRALVSAGTQVTVQTADRNIAALVVELPFISDQKQAG
jgi:folate-binding protein YgfZ